MNTQTTNTNSYVFTISECADNADRVATPLVLANSALANGGQALLWLTMSGVELARKGVAQKLGDSSFASVNELLNVFIESGGKIGICPPCAKTHGLTDENKLEATEWMGGVAMLSEAQNSQTFTF